MQGGKRGPRHAEQNAPAYFFPPCTENSFSCQRCTQAGCHTTKDDTARHAGRGVAHNVARGTDMLLMQHVRARCSRGALWHERECETLTSCYQAIYEQYSGWYKTKCHAALRAAVAVPKKQP